MTQLQRVGLGAMLYASRRLSGPFVIWLGLILLVSGKDKKHGPE